MFIDLHFRKSAGGEPQVLKIRPDSVSHMYSMSTDSYGHRTQVGIRNSTGSVWCVIETMDEIEKKIAYVKGDASEL
jgi:hypothetical protein